MTSPPVVAITGGTGFIGSAILKSLISANYSIRALVRTPEKFELLSGVEIVQGHLNNSEGLRRLCQGSDIVIHCAGQIRGKHYREFETDNVLGTALLCETVQQYSPQAHFINISSLSARYPGLSHYAHSKQQAEEIVSDLTYWTSIRPPAVYGPLDTELKPLFDAMRKGICWCPGKTSNRFSMLHVEDLSQVIMTIIQQPNNHIHAVYEPDDGLPGGYDWDFIQKIASKVFGRRVQTITVPKSILKGAAHINMVFSTLNRKAPMLTPGKVNELTFDNWVVSLNKRIPGWQAKIQLNDGLKNLYALEDK